jgi:hypothetical protein
MGRLAGPLGSSEIKEICIRPPLGLLTGSFPFSAVNGQAERGKCGLLPPFDVNKR